MKKHLLIMWSLLLCFATGAWAADGVSTLTFEDECGGSGTANDGVQWTITSDGSESTHDPNKGIHYGTGSAAVQYIRLTTSGITYPIKKIVVNASTAKGVSATVSVTVGGEAFGGAAQELTSSAADYEFTGSASGEIVVNVTKPESATKALYVKSVAVTYEIPAGTPMAPTISGEDSFFGSTSVTIDNNEEDATVYYTTDESDPTTSTTAKEYTDAFDISATTTVKAAAKKGDKWSAVASKTFTAIPSYANIEALTALENNATFGFTGELLVVAKPTAKYAYVKDATGATLIYDDSGTKLENLEKGKTIAAPWTGKVSIYNKLFEAVPDAALTLNDGEAVPVTYDEASIADLTSDNVNKVVVLKGVTYTLGTGKNFTIKQGEDNVAGYNNFGLTIEAAVEGQTYEMVGAISRYNATIQFQPISITKTYKIKIENIKIENTDVLTITPDVTTAKAGDKVYASYVLADHYQLEFPDFVDDDGQPIEFKEGETAGLEEVGGVMKMWFIMPEKNVTIKAKATKLYQLSMTQPENGTITVISVNMGSDPYSKAGKTIRMMVTANEGYVIKSVEVKDANDAAVTVSPEDGIEHDQAYNYVFTMPASNVKIGATIQKEPEDININPETGADISQALAAASEGKNVRNITINLAKNGEYTISNTIETTSQVTIAGPDPATLADGEKAPVINASSLSGALIKLAGSTTYAKKSDDTESTFLWYGNVAVKNLSITGLKKQLVQTSETARIDQVLLENSVVEMAAQINVFDLGYAFYTDLTIKNSTIWGTTATNHNKYLIKTDGRCENLEKVNSVYPKDVTTSIINSTLYNIARNQKLNNSNGHMKGKTYNVQKMENSILVNVGTNTGNEVNGWGFGANSANMKMSYKNNTYITLDAEDNVANVSGWTDANKTGSDQSSTSLTTNPGIAYVKAEAGDFTIDASTAQAKFQTGDPRWLVDYVAPVNTITITAPENGSVVTDPATEAAEGATVTITATPNEGYEVDAVTVVDADGAAVTTTDGATAGTYTFTMPFKAVTVTVTFKVATGINTINADKAAENLENAEIYTLNGQRVEKPRKGLYIVNGKKVVIK